MGLVSLLSLRNCESTHSRSRSRQLHYQPTLDGLESRLVLSAAVASPEVAAPPPPVHPAPPAPPAHAPKLAITGITVNDVALSGNQLIANANLNGTIMGASFSLPLTIPVSLTPATVASPSSISPAAVSAAATATQVLNLSLGPIDLSLLGLNVHLGAQCNPGGPPITVTLTAIPSGTTFNGEPGGLLGDVLGGVANLLNGGGLLGSLGSVAGVTGGAGTLLGSGSLLSQLENGLTGILNGVLSGLSSATPTTPTGMVLPPHTSEVLELPLGPINLDLLGAYLQTSTICLNITATRGPGDLLGNLLG